MYILDTYGLHMMDLLYRLQQCKNNAESHTREQKAMSQLLQSYWPAGIQNRPNTTPSAPPPQSHRPESRAQNAIILEKKGMPKE